VAYDYGLLITADPPSSRSLDHVPVVHRWFDGISCNYGVPHLMISAVTELYLGLLFAFIDVEFKLIVIKIKLGIASGLFLLICSWTWQFS
jgi:hypothetical protein